MEILSEVRLRISPTRLKHQLQLLVRLVCIELTCRYLSAARNRHQDESERMNANSCVTEQAINGKTLGTAIADAVLGACVMEFSKLFTQEHKEIRRALKVLEAMRGR